MTDQMAPKLQTESSGGSPPRGTTRLGANTQDDDSKRVRIDKNLTVKELAQKLQTREVAVIKYLFYEKQIPRTVNEIVEVEIARQVAIGMGYNLIRE